MLQRICIFRTNNEKLWFCCNFVGGKRGEDPGLNPSIRDAERAALVDETVEVLSNVIW